MMSSYWKIESSGGTPSRAGNAECPFNEQPIQIKTIITGGFPVLFSISNAQFEIPSFNQGGTYRMRLRFGEIAATQLYDERGDGSETNPIHFQRIKKCPEEIQIP